MCAAAPTLDRSATGKPPAASAYIAFGLQWRSSINLPFAVSPSFPKAPDLTVRLGETPEGLPGAAGGTPHLFEAAPGAALLRVAGVARYFVTPREVVIDPQGGNEEDFVAFLVGPVLAALLQMRGLLSLHAASVEMDAGAVLLLGGSGAGKSALAAMLVQRGHALLADDLTALAPAADGVLALPAFPRLRLWRDALRSADRRQRVRRNLEQYWKPATRFAAAPRPVRAAFVLESHNRPDFDIEPVPPSRAFWTLWEHTYRKRLLDALGQRRRHYRIGMALARDVPLVLVRRPDHPFRLAELADLIEAQVRGVSPPGATPPRTAADVVPARQRPKPNASVHVSRKSPPRPGIVWIAAYPKSGSTWTRAVLTNYLRDDGEPASINSLVGQWGASARDKFDELIGIDSADLRPDELERHLPRFRELLAEALSVPRPNGRRQPHFAKTHEAYRSTVGGARFSRNGAAGLVYLMRNPLDVAVSYAHHLQLPIDQTMEWMNNPAADEAPAVRSIRRLLPNPLTTWSGHVSSWLEQKDLRTHAVRYEDLLADPHAGFGAIVRFAGLAWDEARLHRAVKHAAFSGLQAQEAEFGFGERQQTAPSFFRAGAAGSWRRALTRTQVQALVEAHGPVMDRLGYLREAEAFLSG